MTQPSKSRITIEKLIELEGSTMCMELIAGENGLGRHIDNPRIQKPSLAFAGFTEDLEPHRVQIIGNTELHFLSTKSAQEQKQVVDQMFKLKPSAFVVTRGQKIPDVLVKAAEETGTPLILTTLKTTPFMTNMTLFLSHYLAPTTYQHGVYMDVFGLGVLVIGSSGIGKSEIALELISRGHRLIADDMVELRRESADVLVGRSPESLKYHMEIRGLGIINIRDLFGAAAITDTKRVGLVVELIQWKDMYAQDHLLVQKKYIEIHGVRLPKVQAPIRPGRSLAIMVEVATRDALLKRRGVDSGQAFVENLQNKLKQKN